MPIDVLHKTPLPRINCLIRLTAKDTRFLAERIMDASQRGTGVNMVLEGLNGAACLICSAERGRQISINAYSDGLSYRVETPMRGYNGPWSHIELIMEPKLGQSQLGRFLLTIKGIG